MTAGMVIAISKKLYRVESVVKVTVPKGTPFIKVQLRDLSNNKVMEKNFKTTQTVDEITMIDRPVEFLYPEGKDYLFLDTQTLEQVLIPSQIVGDAIHYLKEGIELTASYYGEKVFALELPQFLELMVSKLEGESGEGLVAGDAHVAILETGAKVDVPPFVEIGDIIKVNTKTHEYIQRV